MLEVTEGFAFQLVGSQCNDIDIALENMMGVPFAERFVEYCRTVKDLAVKTVAKIESNPDQSKHLETARTTVMGIELDFVNLRSEEYAENSRIPTQVTFGTPLQDAIRRDITINSLFYNVHSRKVEDHTGKGLDDLRNGIVRTPLPPRETFADDPLRVLRCIRFASRFGFTMVSELQDAAKDPTIQEALRMKISRERVGEELDKMMGGRNPLLAIDLINVLSLYSSVFSVPENTGILLSEPPSSLQNALKAAVILHALSNPESSSTTLSGLSVPPLPAAHPLLLSELTTQNSPSRRLYLAAALTPYRNLIYTQKNKMHPATEAVLRDGLKLGVQYNYSNGIPALFAAADVLQKGVADFEAGNMDKPERVWIGLLLRERNVHNPISGSFWATSLLFSLVQELTALWGEGVDPLGEAASARIAAYNKFTARIEELDLPPAVDAKSILNGREAVDVLGAASPGPWTGEVLARIIEWQLEHPHGTKGECEAWLRAEQAAGHINIVVGKRVKDGSADAKSKKAKR
ncbi:CCA tRNA nucleotidyltransferase, mitochondrial [Trametes pubescens]|uniref:CCA tRNA nucleotidyltransferase, mitochondrial n=1 Tax=Trametes pubescens TaxID=154538 RepID=A0A1M2W0C3_TRAPU|nr:CCA tRNA nucleotidyltransferase, mitochondrial [Trametes pubescens]